MAAEDDMKTVVRSYLDVYPRSKPSFTVSFFEGDGKKSEEFILLITDAERLGPSLQGAGLTLDAAVLACRKNLAANFTAVHTKEVKAYQARREMAEAFHDRLQRAASDLDPLTRVIDRK